MDAFNDDGSRDWTEPGVYTVAPGVHRIPLPLPNDGLRAVNVYALTGGDDVVLIDAGWSLDAARDRLAEALRAIGTGFSDIREYLITHVHRDHYTQAVTLRREFGGRIGLGAREQSSLKLSSDPDGERMDAQGRLLELAGARPVLDELIQVFGELRPDPEIWEEPDEWLTPGKRTVLPGRELDLVHTPGHTAGHLVFEDPAAGLLFTGDHVLPHITPSIGFEPATVELPLRDYLDSLRLVRERPDRRMLPAHGPVTSSVHARVDELLAHHAERLDVMGGRIADGATTAYEAALGLTWTRRRRQLSEMDVFNRMLATLETAAHLDLLVAQGKLSATRTGGVRHYSLP
ncbi:MBL fold metallo-hydrolase [Amycolatopsis minnesotensis]|uniref:MBL fold metallo-hydrolase n=1 Tax=Amycolatopsis minnesotensis TaxID=337894 RepID=A0ABP5CSK9_9PSEU